jgi:hypothetical protein
VITDQFDKPIKPIFMFAADLAIFIELSKLSATVVTALSGLKS